MFKTYADVLAHLDHLGLFHMDFSLHRMHTALNRLGLLQPHCPVIQVLGTNGKGSTSTFLASLGRVHSLRTGLYTSPHFVSPAERIRIDGSPLPEHLWPALANQVMHAHRELTYFEFMTLLALLAFRECGTELIILEAGLGGEHDATTAIHADLLCYAPIGMDHMAILGDTLGAIATDKAGAIRGTAPVVSAPQEPEALARLRTACCINQAPLTVVDGAALREISGMELGLRGPHQHVNAAVALAAWRTLHRVNSRIPLSLPAIRKGLARAFLPGRFQQIPARCALPALWLDGAHNEHGMRALAAAVEDAGLTPSAVIFSCLKDKDWQDMCRLLLHAAHRDTPFIVPAIHNERAADCEELAACLRGMGASQVRTARDISLALSLLDGLECADAPVLICGSLYLLSEFYTLFPQYLQPIRRREECP